jgi:hypothetical protein
MAIIQTGVASGVAGGNLIIDQTFQAARIAERPPECLGSYSMSLISGALTGIAAGTTGSLVSVYSFRWAPATTTQLCMIRRIEIGFNTTTAFGTAQSLQYNLMPLRTFSVNQSGTTPIIASFSQTNTGKHRTSMPTSAMAGGGGLIMSNATALTGTSFTADSQFMASISGSSTAIGTSIPMTPIFQHQSGDYPLIFANNEGFMINNGQLMGATGVGNLIVNVEWMELAATTGNAIAY